MDSTMKKYEHRQLEWVCEHECNVGEKYVLPQAEAFGLSWSMPMDQSVSWGRSEMQQPLPHELQLGGGLPPSSSRTCSPPPSL